MKQYDSFTIDVMTALLPTTNGIDFSVYRYVDKLIWEYGLTLNYSVIQALRGPTYGML